MSLDDDKLAQISRVFAQNIHTAAVDLRRRARPEDKYVVDVCVSWAASPAAENRTVYTGTIERIEGDLAHVREHGWLQLCSVRLDKLHDEGAYEIIPTGPRGIRWMDR